MSLNLRTIFAASRVPGVLAGALVESFVLVAAAPAADPASAKSASGGDAQAAAEQ
jgi:hypothetical protein